jgi:2-alkyl-3-oxoalkanoate reductase
MKVFVTGGTGTLGRGVVKKLVGAGHTVLTLSRSDANDLKLRELGAEPVRVKLGDVAALEGVDAILHLASKVPDMAHIGRRKAHVEMNHIRREGTRNLVDAALKTGVRVFIYPSVILLYPDGGGDWLEANTTSPSPEEYLPASLSAATLDAEREVTRFAASRSSARGVSLRMGGFYSSENPQSQMMVRFAQRGLSPLFGHDDGFMSMLWVDDASSAVVAAVEKAPSGVDDVVDDEPLTRREIRCVMAKAVGRSNLWRIPDVFAGVSLGVVAPFMMRSLRVSNARFKTVTGWTPKVKNLREGWAKIASDLALKGDF